MPRMTVPEAARYAGRNPETLRRWIREGKLKSERVGTQYLVFSEDVASVLSGGDLELPAHWQKADRDPMPPWEKLVREGRQSH